MDVYSGLASQCLANVKMAKENENNENERVAVGIRLDGDDHAAVAAVMANDNRPSVANTVETLIRTHPRIKKIKRGLLETAQVEATV